MTEREHSRNSVYQQLAKFSREEARRQIVRITHERFDVSVARVAKDLDTFVASGARPCDPNRERAVRLAAQMTEVVERFRIAADEP